MKPEETENTHSLRFGSIIYFFLKTIKKINFKKEMYLNKKNYGL